MGHSFTRKVGRVLVRDDGGDVGARSILNLIEGTNITLTFNDDSANDEVDITIAATGGGSSPLTTKGDIWVYTTADARLAVGTNGQILVADSAQTEGVDWVDKDLVPFTFSHAGELSASTVGVSQIPMGFSGELVYTRARVSTAPTGADIVIDVNKGAVGSGTGSTVYATSKPTITATNFDSGNDAPPSTVTFSAGDWFSIDVDSVGSTVAGSDLVVVLYVRPD